eukprot:15019469-Alexandrium_andersonii.AAC.1
MEKEALSLRAKAKTAEHLRTHFPKIPWCPICQRANARRKQRRDKGGQKLFGAATFGHTIAADHVIAAADKDGVGKGLGGIQYIDMMPVISRTAEVAERAVDFFIGSSIRY